MPVLARITNTFFTTLINRLGIRPPPSEGFEISNVVTPVSIVDSDITLSAISTTLNLDTPFTQGELAAPLANTVLADTGALAAGNYSLLIMIGVDTTAGGALPFRIQRRDAANAVTVWGQLGSIEISSETIYVLPLLVTLLLNERIRVISGAATATGTVQASIWARIVT